MIQEKGVVNYDFTDSTGKKANVKEEVIWFKFENADDIMKSISASKEQLDEILVSLNYGTNLRARAIVRLELQKKVDGPGKAIERQVKGLIDARAAMGKPITEEAARAKVMASLAD